jgi:hypothetical protein
VRDLADLVGLRDWTTLVEHDAAPAGAVAEVQFRADRRELRISFGGDFEDLDADEQRYAVAHELVHPHLGGVWAAVEEGAHEAFGGIAYRVYTGTVRREVERSVDAVAAVLAAHLPLPPWSGAQGL